MGLIDSVLPFKCHAIVTAVEFYCSARQFRIFMDCFPLQHCLCVRVSLAKCVFVVKLSFTTRNEFDDSSLESNGSLIVYSFSSHSTGAHHIKYISTKRFQLLSKYTHTHIHSQASHFDSASTFVFLWTMDLFCAYVHCAILIVANKTITTFSIFKTIWSIHALNCVFEFERRCHSFVCHFGEMTWKHFQIDLFHGFIDEFRMFYFLWFCVQWMNTSRSKTSMDRFELTAVYRVYRYSLFSRASFCFCFCFICQYYMIVLSFHKATTIKKPTIEPKCWMKAIASAKARHLYCYRLLFQSTHEYCVYAPSNGTPAAGNTGFNY